MNDRIEQMIEAYKAQFEAERIARRKARSQEREFSDLGHDVIDRSFRKLVGKLAPDFDLEALAKGNRSLSEKLAQHAEEAEREMRKMPDAAARQAMRHTRMMQDIALQHHHSGVVPSPPQQILIDADPSEGRTRCEVTADLALGRVYPVLNVWGAGKSGLRDAEVVCDYFWSFTPKTSGAHYVTPHIEIHGYEVITLEHHCFHDSSGTTREFEVLMDVSQSGIVSPVAMAGPQNLGHGRIDTWRWPNYPTFLRADVEALAVVRIRLRAVARNEYARSSMNFGDPPAENFIGMPWLCWSEFT